VVEEIGCTSLYSSAMHVFLWYTNPMITNRMCTHYNTTILVIVCGRYFDAKHMGQNHSLLEAHLYILIVQHTCCDTMYNMARYRDHIPLGAQ